MRCMGCPKENTDLHFFTEVLLDGTDNIWESHMLYALWCQAVA